MNSACTVCPFCLEPVTSVEVRVRPDGGETDWHRECWNLEHEDEPIDFVGYGRESAHRSRFGQRGARS